MTYAHAIVGDHVQALGDTFAAVLRVWFTESEWREMRARNARPPYSDPRGPCASHDFCDANEAMAMAFERICGRPVFSRDAEFFGSEDPAHEADCEAWNAAWSYAKAFHLTAHPSNQVLN